MEPDSEEDTSLMYEVGILEMKLRYAGIPVQDQMQQ
jgi:hypothetical protein